MLDTPFRSQEWRFFYLFFFYSRARPAESTVTQGGKRGEMERQGGETRLHLRHLPPHLLATLLWRRGLFFFLTLAGCRTKRGKLVAANGLKTGEARWQTRIGKTKTPEDAPIKCTGGSGATSWGRERTGLLSQVESCGAHTCVRGFMRLLSNRLSHPPAVTARGGGHGVLLHRAPELYRKASLKKKKKRELNQSKLNRKNSIS